MTLAARGADLFDGEAIGVLGIERALCTRVIERSETEVDRERVFDDFDVALVGPGVILVTRAPDQLRVERQADLARSHALKATALPHLAPSRMIA